MITVLHIITRLDWGGSAQNTFLTAIGHDRTRFRPIVLAGDPGPWDAQGGQGATVEKSRLLEKHNIPFTLVPTLTREVNPIKDLKTLRTLVQILRREQPTIVHTHTSKAGVLGRIAAWITRVPIVIHTPHGHIFYGHFGPIRSGLFLLLEYLLAWGTSHLIALTEAEREEHLDRRVGTREHFSVIPSGIDLDRFRQAKGNSKREWRELPIGPDSIVIGSVGWLTEVKGHRFLLEAIGKIHPQYPDLHCVIIGSGPLLDHYKELVDSHNIRPFVHFLNKRDDIPECLAFMDIFVLPSINEGMGRALIEAMAVGLPVVASKVGGVPAIVEHELNGLLVPPGESTAIASALIRLLESPSLRQRLGYEAQQHMTHRFSAEGMVETIESLYEKMLINQTTSPAKTVGHPRPSI